MARLSNTQGQSNGMARTESQQEAVIHSFFKRPKGDEKEIRKFQEKVEGDKRELDVLLQQKLREVDKKRARRLDDIGALISQACRPSSFNDDASNTMFPSYPGTAIALNEAYGAAGEMIEKSKDLVKDYDKIEDMISEASSRREEESIADDWQQDLKNTERLLGLGRRKALRNVQKVLGLEGEHEQVDVGEQNGEDMEGVEEEPQVLNFELQRTLRYAERGVKRMVKSLPHET